jgi:hypothetical protein
MKNLGASSVCPRGLTRTLLRLRSPRPQLRYISNISSEVSYILITSLTPTLNNIHPPQSSPRASPTSPTAPSTRYKNPTHLIPSPATNSERTAHILSLASQYLLPVYARPDFVLSHGKGSYVWDTEGRKYLDFSAGIAVNALGHADEGVVKVCLDLFLYLRFNSASPNMVCFRM